MPQPSPERGGLSLSPLGVARGAEGPEPRLPHESPARRVKHLVGPCLPGAGGEFGVLCPAGVTGRLALWPHTGCLTGCSSASTSSAALLTSSLRKEHTGHHTHTHSGARRATCAGWWVHERGQSHASCGQTSPGLRAPGVTEVSRDLPRERRPACHSEQRGNLILLSHHRGVLCQLLSSLSLGPLGSPPRVSVSYP